MFVLFSPDLTWRDIQYLIVYNSINTGLHVNASFYTNGAGLEGMCSVDINRVFNCLEN